MTLPRKTNHRFQVINAFFLVGRRHRLKGVQARAIRAAQKLKIGRALLCTCSMNDEGKALFARLETSARGMRELFRTKR